MKRSETHLATLRYSCNCLSKSRKMYFKDKVFFSEQILGLFPIILVRVTKDQNKTMFLKCFCILYSVCLIQKHIVAMGLFVVAKYLDFWL